ncbi:MAG: D-lyxose/D-mannose family sugar isomerase [Lentisphaeria bacterium]
MKRSEINAYIAEARAFFHGQGFRLPPFAGRSPEEWRRAAAVANLSEIMELKLGWDVTDNGQGRFAARGLLLFTIRNGGGRHPKPYAEKIMMVRERQETPMHFHWNKMEDIINRGGGDLHVCVYNAGSDDGLAETPVSIAIDGERRVLPAGSWIVLTPGESVSLPPRLYHSFHAEGGPAMIGEVSMVNDDETDNRFLEPLGRFPSIEEDVPPAFLLCTDYATFLQKGSAQ